MFRRKKTRQSGFFDKRVKNYFLASSFLAGAAAAFSSSAFFLAAAFSSLTFFLAAAFSSLAFAAAAAFSAFASTLASAFTSALAGAAADAAAAAGAALAAGAADAAGLAASAAKAPAAKRPATKAARSLFIFNFLEITLFQKFPPIELEGLVRNGAQEALVDKLMQFN